MTLNFRISAIAQFLGLSLLIATWGYPTLSADLRWLQLLNYLGNSTVHDLHDQQLASRLTQLLALDPYFLRALLLAEHVFNGFSQDSLSGWSLLLQALLHSPQNAKLARTLAVAALENHDEHTALTGFILAARTCVGKTASDLRLAQRLAQRQGKTALLLWLSSPSLSCLTSR